MLLQQVEQLAGHHGAESAIRPLLTTHPFVVGSGMADQRVGRHAGRDGAEQLDFLAAHDVGAAVADIAQAGDDRRALASPNKIAHQIRRPRSGHGT